MLNLTKEQRLFLKENFKNAEKMMETDSVRDILMPLDALITYKGFDDDYVLTKWGNVAQRMYDDIYMQNVKEYNHGE
ncbi:MAG: hypothetical protein RR661_03000 [Anaerovoracaceae bacterium]